MLRASRLYKGSVNRAFAAAKRHASTTSNTTEVRKGSIGGKLVGVTVVGAATYGGAVYYATTDKAFRDTFVSYVPGGKESVEFFEDLKINEELTNYQKQATTWKQQAEGYGAKAQEYSNQARDAAMGAYDYANDTYQKLAGQKETPKLQTSSPVSAIEEVKVKEEAPKKKVEIQSGKASVSTDKKDSTPVVEAAIEKPAPIVLKSIKTNNTVVRELSTLLNELATILNDTGMSSKGREVMKEAEDQLEALSKRYSELDTEQAAVLNSLVLLQQKSKQVEAGLEKYRNEAADVLQSSHVETARRVGAKQTELVKEFEEARTEMKKTFATLLAKELDSQKTQLDSERSQALLQQSEEMKRRFIREVKYLVEKERASRLGKLELINARFTALEKQSLDNAANLDRSRQSHLMRVTFGALHDVITRVHKASFVDELEAFKNSAKYNELLQVVLSSIPREVAEEGVESMGDLTTRFEIVADEVRRVALVPEDGGFGSHIISMILAHLMFRKEGLVEGGDVEAILARSGYHLKNGDLEDAARELNQLKGWPKRLAQDWILAARRHLEIQQVLEVAETQTILNSLLEA
ncbi:mitochondrial inner membrane protein Mitofilin [Zychaea mexicana]|uniref:mitochondrial inner membrane protein Mitofilin n=1 Tax=Zychaea mexicana TaxID=64656 RepID=UPI0022FED5A9|nr:mitochondrial inner membrane protein Mitofilin [Zychaea mexicana]KAI9490729.1 mitochondrial inner membrane protein Mitofilin [Zychaea mexicana]